MVICKKQLKKRVGSDNYLIEKYKEDFKDSKIKIDTYMKKKLGIQLKNIFIKIDQLYIYCVPYEFSLTGSKVILVLKENEFRIFEQNNKQKNRLHLKFRDDSILDKKVSFFIWASYLKAEPYDESLNLWLIELEYLSVPLIYSEFLINLFLENEKYLQIYNDNKEKDNYFDQESLKNKNIQKYALINKNRYLIVKISVGKLFIITEKSSDSFSENNISIGLLQSGECYPLFISGTVLKNHNISGIKDKLLAEIKLDFSPRLVEILS